MGRFQIYFLPKDEVAVLVSTSYPGSPGNPHPYPKDPRTN